MRIAVINEAALRMESIADLSLKQAFAGRMTAQQPVLRS